MQQFLLLVGGAARDVRRRRARPRQVLDSFLLRSLAVAGYAPSFEAAPAAGSRARTGAFNPAAGGDALRDLPGARLGAARRRRPSAARRPAGRRLAGRRGREPRHRREAAGLVAAYLHWHLERGLKSLAYVER